MGASLCCCLEDHEASVIAQIPVDVCSGTQCELGFTHAEEWRVVYKLPFPVHAEKTTEPRFLGVKKKGEIVRGYPDGEWLVLADEPGFMRIFAVGSGKVVLERVEDEPQQPLPAGLHQKWQQLEEQEVEEAQPADESDCQLDDEICTWRVVYKMSFPVHSQRFTSSEAVSRPLCLKKPGQLVRGKRHGDWVVLTDEPGFMRIEAVGSGIQVLEKLEAKVCAWKVAFEPSVPVHSDRSSSSTVLTAKRPGAIVRGAQDGNWFVLVDEPGFMQMTDEATGCTLLEKTQNEQAWAAKVGGGDICILTVIRGIPFAVHSVKSSTSGVLATKRRGEILRGFEDGEWLALVDEPGFMRITAACTGERLLENTGAEEPPATLGSRELEEAQAPVRAVRAEILQGTFCVTLDKGETGLQKLGVDVSACMLKNVRYLKIRRIRQGLVHEWNSRNRANALREGDIILEVNGVRGGSEELYGIIANDKVLKLVVMRQDDNSASPQSKLAAIN